MAAVVAWAIEVAWTASRVGEGRGLIALALAGTNLAIGLVATGVVFAAGTTTRNRSARRCGAERVVSLSAVGFGGILLVAAVAWAHDRVGERIATSGLRGPAVGVVALVVAAGLVGVGPGVLRRVTDGLAAVPRAVRAGVAIVLGAGWIAAGLLGVWRWRGFLGELDPQLVLSVGVPVVACAVGWVAGPAVARRALEGRGRLRWTVSAALGLMVVAAAGLLTTRPALRSDLSSVALQSRLLAAAAGSVRRSEAAAPGPAARLFGGEPAPVGRAVARHLVLVTIDALRIDHLGLGRMRELGRLAARSVTFDSAYSAVPGSLRALPPLLTGMYPNALAWRRRPRVHVDPARSVSVAERFAQAGFDTRFVPHTRYVLNAGTSQGFASVLDPVLLPEESRRRNEPRDEAMVAATLAQFEDDPPRAGERLFLWSHFIDPHAPYWGRHRGHSGGEVDRYAGEVEASDRALGTLLRGLERLAILRDAIVVVTADHGEEFGEHGTNRHSRTLWDAAVRVPLVVSAPGVEPRRIVAPVSHVDVAPTVLDLLGLPVPRGLDGRSLARTVLDGRPPPHRTLIMVAYPMHDPVPALYGAVRDDWKLLTDRDGRATTLIRMRSDRAERRNQIDRVEPRLVRELEADVARYRARGLGEAR